jgi:major type 1 subunit fimbrin (pilin)
MAREIMVPRDIPDETLVFTDIKPLSRDIRFTATPELRLGFTPLLREDLIQ